ncbi:MAG: ammonia-forming cytochrome c nitrite reductase subunit c552 [Christensenellaceae bacterium]|nr:ammonia-forming cytochrome c nitrite reductase subunit c552 [Christensenellaceae bacterium]
MKKGKRLVGLLLIIGLLLCLSIVFASNPRRAITSEFVPESRVENFEDVKNADDWYEQFPHVVESFRKGGEASQEDIDQFGIFAENGHSKLEQTFTAAYPTTPESFSVSCLACHSSGYEWAYKKYGDDVLNITWSDVKDDNPGMDFWSCYLCHGNQPGEILTTNSIYSSKITDDIPNFAPGEAVCAQCHTVFTGLEALTSDLEGVYDVHKNGYDLDGIYDALVECTNKNPNQSNDALLDGVVYDEATGIKTYGTGSYLDIEMFQGSTHQKMGLSCVDCHMPIEVAEDGTEYRSHNASGSVFESEAAMNLCMQCHTSEHVKTADDLINFTKLLQNNASDRYFKVREVQAELKEAIIAAMKAGVNEEVIQAARDAYSRGDYYLAYSKKVEADYVQGPVPGTTSIHNYSKVLEYYDKAEALFKEHTANLN